MLCVLHTCTLCGSSEIIFKIRWSWEGRLAEAMGEIWRGRRVSFIVCIYDTYNFYLKLGEIKQRELLAFKLCVFYLVSVFWFQVLFFINSVKISYNVFEPYTSPLLILIPLRFPPLPNHLATLCSLILLITYWRNLNFISLNIFYQADIKAGYSLEPSGKTSRN